MKKRVALNILIMMSGNISLMGSQIDTKIDDHELKVMHARTFARESEGREYLDELEQEASEESSYEELFPQERRGISYLQELEQEAPEEPSYEELFPQERRGVSYLQELEQEVSYEPSYEELTKCFPKKRLGKSYLYALQKETYERRWALPFLGSVSLAYKGFNDCNKLIRLDEEIFGKIVEIQDISLFSLLCNANKVRIDNVPAREPVRPAGSPATFGSYRTDLYPTLLAPTQLRIEAEQRDFCIDIGAQYRFFLTRDHKLVGTLGINVPIKSRLHIMDLNFIYGDLFYGTYTQTGEIRETSLNQFANDFISIYDFFQKGILADKNLEFRERQRRMGVGDISTFGYLDFGNYFSYTDSVQVGLNIVFPSGGSENSNRVWDPVLGNGGAFQFEGYTSLLFRSNSPTFNPTLRIVGQVSVPFTHNRRVPHLVTNDERQRIFDVPDLLNDLTSTRFEAYYVDPFEEFDTQVPFFADRAILTRTKIGSRLLVSGGNYFYNVLNLGLRLGIFYDFGLKGKDSVRVTCNTEDTFNTGLLESFTNQRFQRIGWNLTYKTNHLIEFNIGSQHIIAGRNIARVHNIFASIIAVF